jgi:uncharacterized protein YPO0396
MDTGLLRRPGQGAPPSFTLRELEVYNWGAFTGRHTAEFDVRGTAIIGPTGSGKTTLVDALMTLIAAHPRYNLASTGGHDSDRELISYIRGVSGAGNNSGDNEHVNRPGKTVSALSARFDNEEEQVILGAVFAIDGTSFAQADVKRWWIFSRELEQGLERWLTAHQEGGGRALKLLGRETAGLHIYDSSKNAYLAQVRRFFEVGENAFALLNRAAGLKQLDSIDELFRELVLEDSSAFVRAGEVARQFDDLATIHSELEIARQQQESLRPVHNVWQMREQRREEIEGLRALKAVLPRWYATHAHRLWTAQISRLDDDISRCEGDARKLTENINSATADADTLRDLYLQAGGSSIEQLRELVEVQQRQVKDREADAQGYQRIAVRLGLDPTLTAEALLANQRCAAALEKQQASAVKVLNQAAWEAGVAEERDKQERARFEDELKQVKARPGSNIPIPDQQFRAALAEQLNLPEEELPHLAELIEVKPTQANWRGAIERAVGGQRLRILVPEACMKRALSWVNARDNRLHVRLQEARAVQGGVEYFSDSFIYKLNFKPHSLLGAARALLASADRHCVSSAEALLSVPFGLTEQGTMSGKNGQFDKQDHKPLSRDWLTGFDNKARVNELSRELDAIDAALAASRKAHEQARKSAEEAKQRQNLLAALSQLEFPKIDLPGAQRHRDSLSQRLAALSTPDSDSEKARARWQAAYAELQGLRRRETDLTREQSRLATLRDEARAAQQRAFQRVGEGLTDSEQELADRHLTAPAADELSELSDIERAAATQVQNQVSEVEKKLADTEKDLVREMARAKKVDTGALAEVGTDIIDIDKYLERLHQLTEEALPEKLQRFLDYLNQSSDQGVTQLLSDIDNEVSMIEERIEDLNATLRRVDFQLGRFLRLQPQRVTHESLRELQQAQRHLRSAAMKDDQGESHFRALKGMVALLREASERKTTRGARELLDPRYRLHFAVSVIARDTGAVIEVRTGSQGGSGGEKEIIASYLLTASLSYALCPPANSRPLFATIVLDEAFSKSSHAVASRIISALAEFGLHPLFVTPNKELRLLREHTRSAILVHRKGRHATLTSLSWETLEEHARLRGQAVTQP